MTGDMLAFIPSGSQWIVIAIIGLLLFGKRLPDVGRSLGKGIVEFKKGIKGVEDDIELVSDEKQRATLPPPSQPQVAAPAQGFKFDPYTGKPIEEAEHKTA